MKVDVREKLEIYSPVGYNPLIVVLCHHPMLAPGPSPDPPQMFSYTLFFNFLSCGSTFHAPT